MGVYLGGLIIGRMSLSEIYFGGLFSGGLINFSLSGRGTYYWNFMVSARDLYGHCHINIVTDDRTKQFY